MNWYYISAAALMLAIGLIHSVLGERLVFRRMRPTGLIPTHGGQLLREPQVRILWASWHVVTVLGWCLALVLVWLALPASRAVTPWLIPAAIVSALLASSVLVLVGTRGKHPGWVGLLAAALFTLAGLFV